MNETTLPPSPNWYLSNIISCSKNGHVAWGSNNNIVFAKSTEKGSLNYTIIPSAHEEKVTALSFNPESNDDYKNLLLSGGDESTIKIWNIETNSVVYSHTLADKNQKVISVDWSKKDSNFVYAVTQDGVLISWNLKYKAPCITILKKVTVMCMASCPHDENIVAIGAKGGLVYIVDTRTGSILYKLRGHDLDVVSLSWCPSDRNVISDNDSRDLLLASGGKDRSVYIWRVGKDGRYEVQLNLPAQPVTNNQHRNQLNSNVGNWSALCWVEPKKLCLSSPWAELLVWNVAQLTKNKPIYTLVHAEHGRGLFSIACTPPSEDWRNNEGFKIWTVAQDRQIICCQVAEKVEVVYKLTSQGGYVYCVAACPLDTAQIAFGAGDAILRLWNLSEPYDKHFEVSMLWQKIRGKIRSLAWHPEKENLVAFGTDEGRIGIFDTNGKKPPLLYRQYYRYNVYTLCWAPWPNQPDKYSLFACGDGEIVYYDSEKPNKEPTVTMKGKCTELAWKGDYSVLAIGQEDGCINFVNGKLVHSDQSMSSLICRVYHLKKSVQCMSWHPESTTNDSTFSPMRNYLAIGTNDTTITILDMSRLVGELNGGCNNEDGEVDEIGNKTMYRVAAELKGHMDRITCLAWSPHVSGLLVSGSCDHTAQVWNVETQELLATYMDHLGNVFCCMWSPLDPDLIITGSTDFTLRIWRLSDQKPREITNVKKARQKKSKKKKATNSNKHAEEIEKDIEKDVEEIVTPSKSIVTNQAKQDGKRKKTKHYFINYNKSTKNQPALLQSMRNLAGCSNEEPELKLVFGPDENVSSMLSEEKLTYVAAEQHNIVTELDLWSGNLKDNLEEAMRQRRLNDYLVALAPSLSVKFWQEMCEAYASQLVLDGNPTKAVSYLLCIHKTHEAVKVLFEAKLFLESYVLARLKLPSDDALIPKIVQEWASFASKCGAYDDGALCYIALGDFTSAAKLLIKRNNLESLELAKEFALSSGDKDLSNHIAETIQLLLEKPVEESKPEEEMKEISESSAQDSKDASLEKEFDSKIDLSEELPVLPSRFELLMKNSKPSSSIEESKNENSEENESLRE